MNILFKAENLELISILVLLQLLAITYHSQGDHIVQLFVVSYKLFASHLQLSDRRVLMLCHLFLLRIRVRLILFQLVLQFNVLLGYRIAL